MKGDKIINTMSLEDLLSLWDDVRPEKGACDQSRRQQKCNKYDVSLSLGIFLGRDSTAAGLRHTRNTVHGSLRDFTRLHQSLQDFGQNTYNLQRIQEL